MTKTKIFESIILAFVLCGMGIFIAKNDTFSQESMEKSNDLSARMVLETDTEQTEISNQFELTDNVKAYCEKYGISITSHAVSLNWDALEDVGTVVESLVNISDNGVDSVGAKVSDITKASDITDSILKSSFNEAESSFTDEEKNIINAYFDVKEDMRIEICEEGFSISQKRDDRNITLNKRTLKNEETKHVYFQNSYVEEISEVEIVNREENLEVLKIKLVNDEIYEYMITNEGCCLYKISIVLAEE